jgi:hypothetical protein
MPAVGPRSADAWRVTDWLWFRAGEDLFGVSTEQRLCAIFSFPFGLGVQPHRCSRGRSTAASRPSLFNGERRLGISETLADRGTIDLEGTFAPCRWFDLVGQLALPNVGRRLRRLGDAHGGARTVLIRRLALLAAWPLLLAARADATERLRGRRERARASDGHVARRRRALPASTQFGSSSAGTRIETTEGSPTGAASTWPMPTRKTDGELRPGFPATATLVRLRVLRRRARWRPRAAATPILLTIVATPAWARGQAAEGCPADHAPRALPLRRDKESAYRDFVGKVAARYGDVGLRVRAVERARSRRCRSLGRHARAVQGAGPERRTGGQAERRRAGSRRRADARGAERRRDGRVDRLVAADRSLSFNLYKVKPAHALATIDAMASWCAARRAAPGFFVTEFGAHPFGASNCPGPRSGGPGAPTCRS